MARLKGRTGGLSLTRRGDTVPPGQTISAILECVEMAHGLALPVGARVQCGQQVEMGQLRALADAGRQTISPQPVQLLDTNRPPPSPRDRCKRVLVT